MGLLELWGRKMTPGERFITLIVTILSGVALLTGGLVFTIKLLWNIRGSWDKTNAELHELVGDVRDLVDQKEREHQRLELRDDRLEARVERHEQWHDKH